MNVEEIKEELNDLSKVELEDIYSYCDSLILAREADEGQE